MSVPEYLAGRVLVRLGKQTGAVLRDPYRHRVVWLVKPGATADWDLPGAACVQLLTGRQLIPVPPLQCTRSPHLHWARTWTSERGHTDADLLGRALDEAIALALGPREGVAR